MQTIFVLRRNNRRILDEADEDVFLTTTILKSFSTSIEHSELAKALSDKTLHSNSFFCGLNKVQWFILEEDMKLLYKKNSVLWSTVCTTFSNFSIMRGSAHRFQHFYPNLRLDFKKSKDNLFSQF